MLKTIRMHIPTTLWGLATLLVVSLASAEASTNTLVKPAFTFDQLWDLQNAFWDSFLYPANLKQTQGNTTTVFTPDVQGRVDITRTFDGDELNREYIYGLFSDPESVSLAGIPIAYHITQFLANDNITSATTVVTFNSTTFGVVIPITIDTWIEFSPEGKIASYDATFRWFGYLLDFILKAVATKTNGTSEQAVAYVSDVLAKHVCASSEKYCKGENQQYENSDSCYETLTKKKRFGQPHELGRDTLLCRSIHEHMVKYRPEVHCMHIGPTGGGYCVDDMTYQETVLQKYFTHSWIPYGYGEDKNIWLAN
ncbi:unnamed protein product [Penicillium salamii]|uniref:Uncharacterized protein n=1 Tax=Penicillium salamii TaxID=1612424 RepID=A0A9W4NA09_9EURO|nr:unnamed protein product [Penicillium salamii]CAG8330813.1 unnamed protein product [Penicillium salamii]CAG8339445.1 unnamed protein product [Penicillium salamii]CAG8372758.1 unnamed protein product [Penicillium salamii]